MAENDTHYNGTSDISDNDAAAPLPELEEEKAVYPDDAANIPVAPLPDPGEGGPVYPGNSTSGAIGGNWDWGNNSNNHWGHHGNSWGNSFLPLTPTNPAISPRYYGQVRFLNASTNNFAVNITIDGTAYAINSRFGTISNYDWISDGFHTVTVRRASGMRSVLLRQNFPFTAGKKVTMVLVDSASGGLEMVQISDTGCNTRAYNTGCYRFANMTYSGSRYDLLLYGGETIFRNVAFQTVTPYKQAMAGTYQFYVTSSGNYSLLREIPIIVIGFGGSGTIAFSAYVLGVLSIIISGIMLKKFKIFTGDPAPFVMELPSYHVPTAGNVFRSMWERGSSFIKKAGTVILLSTIFMWFTLGYGWEGGAFCAVADIDNSIMARIGTVIAPIFTLPGFGTWKSAVATISGLVAKENVVATFGQLYHFVGEVAEDGSEIWSELAADFTQVGAYAFMAFNLLCAPCFAAMGAIKREMNNGKWTAFAIGYMCAYAYVVSTIIYQIGGLITGELTFGVGTVVAIAFIALIIFLLFRKPAKADSTEGLRRMSVDAN